ALDRLAKKFDRTFLRIENARNGLEYGGLAGAIGAQQSDDAAARHLEADAADRHDRPVIALDIAELEDDVGSAHGIILMRRDRRRRRRDGAAPRTASPLRERGRS